MKVTLSWLKQYVDVDWPPDELANQLTMLGLEVESVQKLGGEFEGIVVAQVVTRDKHPNADKLSLCRVNDGQGERQIVCGAQNFGPGDKVPLILPGASLPLKPGEQQPLTVKVGKIRGVESHGMLCSPKELGLAEDAEGLLILRQDAKVGQPFAEYLGRAGSDVVLDLEVTPNRPDLNSVIGIAREISAVTGRPLRLPEVSVTSGPLSAIGAQPHALIDEWVAVRLDEPELCPRYVARVVQRVTIGPSPDWLRRALEKVGLRSINNVVDVTNYVMLEIGQPLHAFDHHLLSGSRQEPENRRGRPTIVVRRAADQEMFTTLDGQERTLTPEMLLIADETKGIALAGIMGGHQTQIHNNTRDVLIESAYFKPQNIRRTSKTLGLRSESSYRFERGADLGITDWASRRCVQLILETAGGQLVPGAIDACPRPIESQPISLRYSKVNELLGIAVPRAECVKFLTALGIEIIAQSNEGCTCRIPTWRVDLKEEADLIEEIARLYGVDRIPSTPPRGAIGSNPFDAVYDQIAQARRLLSGLGLDEAQGQTLISAAAATLAAPEESLVWLANPLSNDMNVLRPSLLPGLLDSLRHNLHCRNHDVGLFEIGRVFGQTKGLPNEDHRVAIALTGQRHLPFWRAATENQRADIYDLKGFLEEFLDQFGLRGVTFSRQPTSTSLFLESATISLGGKLALGEMGQLLPTLAKQYDLRDAVFLAELDLEQLLKRRNAARSFKPLAQYPAIRRDVAMLVDENVTHEAVLNAVKQAKPANLECVEVFDVFRGETIPAGKKSVAYSFLYRHADRTLTDVEVNAAHEKLAAQFKQVLQATVRES
jgi:phenylalanyl-tRNA synthetase beta chain